MRLIKKKPFLNTHSILDWATAYFIITGKCLIQQNTHCRNYDNIRFILILCIRVIVKPLYVFRRAYEAKNLYYVLVIYSSTFCIPKCDYLYILCCPYICPACVAHLSFARSEYIAHICSYTHCLFLVASPASNATISI